MTKKHFCSLSFTHLCMDTHVQLRFMFSDAWSTKTSLFYTSWKLHHRQSCWMHCALKIHKHPSETTHCIGRSAKDKLSTREWLWETKLWITTYPLDLMSTSEAVLIIGFAKVCQVHIIDVRPVSHFLPLLITVQAQKQKIQKWEWERRLHLWSIFLTEHYCKWYHIYISSKVPERLEKLDFLEIYMEKWHLVHL